MKKVISFAMAGLILASTCGTALAQKANPTVEARKQMIEKMRAEHKARRNRPHVKRISGTVDKSLKPRALATPVKK